MSEHPAVDEFHAGEPEWRARLGTLRQVVRQELVARQLATHLADRPAQRVLDLGCGQGTQLLRLARQGHLVTGLDSSADLLADLEVSLRAEPPEVRDRVQVVPADLEQVSERFAPASFDVVLCHGVLMYFSDPHPLLAALARLVVPGGLVSLLVRNGDALAMRPALLGDWAQALAAFEGTGYRNRIGVRARAGRTDPYRAVAALTHLVAERQPT
jgi:2-polyprenyl-3-methyl-5-hydroxy-6-metoxy-1,4-benzoquinol methylase